MLSISFAVLRVFLPWTTWYPTRRCRYRLSFFRSKYFIFALFLLILADLQMMRMTLEDTLTTIDGQLHEELYPSDHLMVVAAIEFSYR